MTEWISVKDRLPKDLEDCLCISEKNYITIDNSGQYGTAENWYDDQGDKITHWMPLPPPPSSNT